MTGACVPDGCDTVIPYEQLSDDLRSIVGRFEAGQFIHAAGSDARQGEVLVPAGRRIGPAEVAIAASVGLTTLEVSVRPKIALISSGDEAVPVDARPEAWQIRRSNGPMLEALLAHHGNPPRFHAHVPDDPEVAREVVHGALQEADVVVVCGGISKGKRDCIRPLIEEVLGPPVFHGVAQRPGKPLAFWSGPPLAFALPGNPVSVLATFARYVLPTLSQFEECDPAPRTLPAPAGIEALPRLAWLLTVTADGTPLVPHNSGDFVSIAGAAGVLQLPPSPEFTPGAFLPYFPFHLP